MRESCASSTARASRSPLDSDHVYFDSHHFAGVARQGPWYVRVDRCSDRLRPLGFIRRRTGNASVIPTPTSAFGGRYVDLRADGVADGERTACR